MRRCGFAPNDAEFAELTAAAAEVALSQEDSDLQAQVASLCNVTSARQVGEATQCGRNSVYTPAPDLDGRAVILALGAATFYARATFRAEQAL